MRRTLLPAVFWTTFLSFSVANAYPSVRSRYCPSYCSAKGYYEDGFVCPFYCCGNVTFRICCTDRSLDVSEVYSDVCNCFWNSCTTTNWESLLYVVVPLMVFGTLAVCICKVCVKRCLICMSGSSWPTTATRAHNGIRNFASDSSSSGSQTTSFSSVNEPVRTISQQIEADSHHRTVLHAPLVVTQPPAYDSLARELPKYEDLFTEVQRHDDEEDAQHDSGSRTPSPPPSVAPPCERRSCDEAPPPPYGYI